MIFNMEIGEFCSKRIESTNPLDVVVCIVRISASEASMRGIGSGAGGCGRSSETNDCREKMAKVPKWMKELFGG